MTAAPIRVGIIGCGMVATEYATTMAGADTVQLGACADLDASRAQDLADRYGIPALTVDRLLDPTAINLALILTPPRSHAELAQRAIDSGLPAVWIEKPLTTDPNDAIALIARAKRADVLLGAAPDTLLGPALQCAAAALERGLIGDIRSATAALFSTGPERWHPAPEPFYAEHAGPLGDMGPYYLAALDYLLGPLQVRAATAHTRPDRRIHSGPRSGNGFTAQAPTYVAALLETATGTPVTLTTSFDAAATHAPHIEIHGTEGTLVLPDPNFYDGEVLHRRYGHRVWEPIPQVPAAGPLSRGLGALDLADALREGRQPRCTAERAAGTVRLMATILRTATTPPVPGQTAPYPFTAASR